MKKAWLIRPLPHNIERISEFTSGNIIAIGWPEVLDLVDKNKIEIKEILKVHPNNYSPQQLGVALATVDIFVNRMSIGDYVVVPYEEDIYFSKITSDYFYDPTKVEDGYPHQRNVEWIENSPISRENLPDDLRNSLRAPRTAANLSHHLGLIENIIEGDSSEDLNSVSEFMEVSYPIRTDLNCTITIPKNINQQEAERLGEFIKTLYFS